MDYSSTGDMALVLMIGALSFTILIIGHILTSMELPNLSNAWRLQKKMTGVIDDKTYHQFYLGMIFAIAIWTWTIVL